MTTTIVTVGPDTPVEQAARLMLDHHISGLPVVDTDGAVIGMVSEGDLLHRAEIRTEHRHPWWLRIFATAKDDARDFVVEHGRTVATVMTKGAVTVDVSTPLADIATLLEERRIKRVPVLRDGKLVGLVSRSNLLRAFASHAKPAPAAPTGDDRQLRQAVTDALAKQDWVTPGAVNVLVSDGVVDLWGWVGSDDERKEVAGVKKVVDHLGKLIPWTYA
jgi:CBS domain-containing protein